MIDQADSPAARASGAATSPLSPLRLRERLRGLSPQPASSSSSSENTSQQRKKKKFQSDFSVFSFLSCLALVIISTESC